MPELLTDHAEKLESSITEVETRKITPLMKTGKSPGYDRSPVEYYNEFLDILAPVLQGPGKTNLEKWEKIKLTLLGKALIIKMIVASTFSYVVMILPITIRSDSFKRYDSIIKHFLWEGEKIELNKANYGCCVLLVFLWIEAGAKLSLNEKCCRSNFCG